jgi:hypothetical protein
MTCAQEKEFAMELNLDALLAVWRHIPALVIVITVIVRLANETRRRERLAENFNFDATNYRSSKGEK